MPTSKADAARQAIAFARQDDFLPLIEKWLNNTDVDPYVYQGLPMRPSLAATKILLRSPSPARIGSLYYMNPKRISTVIPHLISLLTHEVSETRAQAELRLRRWTGQSFEHAWSGYDRGRPTLEEGQKTQPLRRSWWVKNRVGFLPKTQVGREH